MDIRKKIEELLEREDWSLASCEKSRDRDEYCAELEAYSPAGEDVIMTIWFDGSIGGFKDAIREYVAGWNPDDNVESWARRGGVGIIPATIQDLVDDAMAIKDMMLELNESINSSNPPTSINAEISLTLEIREGESFGKARNRLDHILEEAIHGLAVHDMDYKIRSVSRVY